MAAFVVVVEEFVDDVHVFVAIIAVHFTIDIIVIVHFVVAVNVVGVHIALDSRQTTEETYISL